VVRFARVFGPTSSQAEVYNHCVEPLLSRILNGQNASVFAYGPTGSGIKIHIFTFPFNNTYSCLNVAYSFMHMAVEVSVWCRS